jgi:hypothetical protein
VEVVEIVPVLELLYSLLNRRHWSYELGFTIIAWERLGEFRSGTYVLISFLYWVQGFIIYMVMWEVHIFLLNCTDGRCRIIVEFLYELYVVLHQQARSISSCNTSMGWDDSRVVRLQLHRESGNWFEIKTLWLYELAAPHFCGAANVLRKWESSTCQLKDILGMLFEVDWSMVGAFTLCVPHSFIQSLRQMPG